MIANDITVANAIDDENHVFTLVSVGDRKSVRQVGDSASSLPHTLTISHELIVRGGQKFRRSLVRIDRTAGQTSDASNLASGAAYMVFEQPYLVWNDSQMKSIIEDLTDVIATSGVLDKLLNGEP